MHDDNVSMKLLPVFMDFLCIQISSYMDYEEEQESTELDAEQLADRAMNIKLVLTDVDGVLTDTGVYYGADGEALKRFSIRDGMGMELLRNEGVDTAFMTRENSPVVKARSEKLKLKWYFAGVMDKAEYVQTVLEQTGLQLENLAYIGDDVNDLGIIDIISKHGLTASPGDAMTSVMNNVHYVANVRGGHGAFRDFADWIIELRKLEE
jgi:3-deoxy-D-manno-octulosonate 8-phosphate phosphatase (KDO 8-P phosphatase)